MPQQHPLGRGQEKILLVPGTGGVALVGLFALQSLVQAQDQDHHVAVLHHRHGLRHAVAGLGQGLHPVPPEVAAFRVQHPAMALHGVLDALQDGDIAGGGAVVVSNQSRPAVGVGADDPDGAHRLRVQGQKPVVFQQHAGLQGSLVGQGQMLRALHRLIGDGVVLAPLPQDAQEIPGGKEPLGGNCNILLGDQPLPQGQEQTAVAVAAVQVTAVFQRQGHGLGGVLRDHVPGVEIPDGPAVGDHMALEAPAAPEDVFQQCLAAAAGLAVGTVVGPHDGLHPGVLDAGLEGGEIGFLHVLGGGHGVKLVPQALRPAVDGEMLGAGGGFHGFAAALEAPDVGFAQLGGEEGVLAVSLVPPAPAGVPEDVDVGGPEGQALVNVPVVLGGEGVVLGPALGGGCVSQLFQKLLVKHGRQADGLGKAGGGARPGHAVKGLVPPVVGGDPQAGNRRRAIAQLAGLFLQAHLRHQSLGPPTRGFSIHKQFSFGFSLVLRPPPGAPGGRFSTAPGRPATPGRRPPR